MYDRAPHQIRVSREAAALRINRNKEVKHMLEVKRLALVLAPVAVLACAIAPRLRF